MRVTPQLQQAIDFLSRALMRSPSAPGSIAQLAREAGVAYTTMWKAVQVLKRDGAVSAAPGRGLTVLASPAETPHSPAPPPAHQRTHDTAERMRSDILRGTYQPGRQLPSRKELAQTYGVSLPTLAKAIRLLDDDGWVRKERRRLMLPPQAQRRGTILVVCAGGENGLPLLPNPRSRRNFRTLEHECNMCGLKVDYALVDPRTTELRKGREIYRQLANAHYSSRLVGAMVWQTGIDDADWSVLVHRFQSVGKPMALFDEAGEHRVPRVVWAKPGVRLYEAGFSQISGKAMGHHLLRLGHRRIAYLSPVHGSVWSRNRLEGIRSAFRGAGFPDAVRAYVHEYHVHPPDTLRADPQALDNLLRCLTCPPDDFPTARRKLLSATLSTLRAHAPRFLQREAYVEHVLPLLQAAFGEGGATAWVAADDDTALPCLDFLESHGVRVPDDISVAGFDDSLDGFMRGLTTYNYVGPAYVRAMLRHVLSPGSPESGGSGNCPVELPGVVVPRHTTGPARRSPHSLSP